MSKMSSHLYIINYEIYKLKMPSYKDVGEKIAVNVKIIPSRDILKEKLDKITLSRGSTIEDLLEIIYRDYVKHDKRDSSGSRYANIFRGYVLMKNSITIGVFDKDGFKPFKEADLQIEDGDEITIMFPPSGG